MAIPLTTALRGKALGWGQLWSRARSTPHLQDHPGPPNSLVRPLGVGTRPESFPILASRDLQSDGTVTAWVSMNRGGQKFKC